MNDKILRFLMVAAVTLHQIYTLEKIRERVEMFGMYAISEIEAEVDEEDDN